VPGQIVVVCPGSCGGALEWKRALGLGPRDGEIVVAETSTLPYAVRLAAPGTIRVHLVLEDGLLLAALPAAQTGRVLDRVREVLPATTAARNVLQTGLQNGNPVLHPAITLLNAARIEATGGELDFYGDGVTPAVGRLIRAVDEERIALGARLGLEIVADPVLGCRQGYMTEATYDAGYSRGPGFAGIRAQRSLDHRYLRSRPGRPPSQRAARVPRSSSRR
jgi:opine dehydrogenase